MSKMNLMEATMLALQGKLDLKENRANRREIIKDKKQESVAIGTEDVAVSVEKDKTEIITDKETITVVNNEIPVVEPVEQEEVSEEDLSNILPEEEVEETEVEEDILEDEPVEEVSEEETEVIEEEKEIIEERQYIDNNDSKYVRAIISALESGEIDEESFIQNVLDGWGDSEAKEFLEEIGWEDIITNFLKENVNINVSEDGKEVEVTTDNNENVEVVDNTEEPETSDEEIEETEVEEEVEEEKIEEACKKEEDINARPHHDDLLAALEDGFIDYKTVAEACLAWLSDDDIKRMCQIYEWNIGTDEEDEELEESKCIDEECSKAKEKIKECIKKENFRTYKK